MTSSIAFKEYLTDKEAGEFNRCYYRGLPPGNPNVAVPSAKGWRVCVEGRAPATQQFDVDVHVEAVVPNGFAPRLCVERNTEVTSLEVDATRKAAFETAGEKTSAAYKKYVSAVTRAGSAGGSSIKGAETVLVADILKVNKTLDESTKAHGATAPAPPPYVDHATITYYHGI